VRLLYLTLLFFVPLLSSATHIVGGNIHYEYLGNDEYLIQLYVYRDCASSSTDFDDPAAVGVFDSNGNLVENIEIPISDAVISDVPVDTGNPCLDPPDGICVKEAIYTATVFLPPIPGGYTLAYQRCCRNTTLVNCESNDDLGSTFFAEIPGSGDFENSNPLFNEYPPVVICLNQPFTFDHSASDLDGDVLVYEFCSPLLTNEPGFYINPPGAPPYPELQFYPEYDFEYPIDSDPAFSIDPSTGLLTGTPTALGQYVVGICVKEYRNNMLIATMNRDFQFNVVLCEVEVIASIPDQTVACDGLTIEFQNNSINASWYWWDFGVDGSQSDTSNLESPTFTYSEPGSYTIMLIANPGLSCSDTAWTSYTASLNIDPGLLAPQFSCVNGMSMWSFGIDGPAADGSSLLWNFGNDASPSTSVLENPNNIQFDDGTGDVVVTLTITTDECEVLDEVLVTIPWEPIADIELQESFCDGLTYSFGNLSEFAETYQWDFGWSDFAEDQSAAFEPETTYPAPGEYDVVLTVSALNTCPDVHSIVFEIYGNLQPDFDQPNAQCLEGNSFDFEAVGASTQTATYLWEFEGASISQSNQQEVGGVTYSTAGWFDVLLTIWENGCEESHLDSVWVVESPQIDLGIQYSEGCPPLAVHFQDLSTSSTPLQYQWQFGDGGTSTAASPVYVYDYPGMYDVTLTISTVLGCATELTQQVAEAVFVYPRPTAYFTVDPIHVNLLEPTVNITDLSEGSVSCNYTTSDGGFIEGCNVSYEWLEPGYQTIVQWVENEWGCRDSIGHIVLVEGFSVFAPNGFTPDHDGLNEVWLPVIVGASEYELQIYNRWGELIFQTNDPHEPWTGNVNGGDHYAQDGQYLYRIVMKDMLFDPHVFVGHISLLR
jgi:gliding motility-associated-like protein